MVMRRTVIGSLIICAVHAQAVFPTNSPSDFLSVGMCGDWNGTSFTQWGTGVAVAPGWIMTARHVGGTRFYLNGTYYPVLQKFHHTATNSADLSLWKLSSPVPVWSPISYRPFAGTNGVQCQECIFVGYGITASPIANGWNPLPGTQGVKRSAKNVLDNLESNVFINFGTFTRTSDYIEYDLDDPSGVNTVNTFGGAAISGEGGIADKDSGCPWFILDSGTYKVCAVSSVIGRPTNVPTNYSFGAFGGGTFVASYQSWVQTTAPELGTMTSLPVDSFAEGTLINGSTASLAASDGNNLRIRSLNLYAADWDQPVGVRVGLQTQVVFPTLLDITIDAKTDGGFASARVWIRNWATNSFDLINTYTVSSTTSRRDILNVPATNHVRSDGRIEVRSSHSSFSMDLNTVDAYFDFIRVVAKT